MSLLKFIVKRLLLGILVLFGLSIVIFIIARVVPGDPARLSVGSTASAEAYQLARESMHLDDPIVKQYGFWLDGVLHGDFGASITTKRSVVEDFKEFFPATIELVLLSALFMIFFSIIFGSLAARYRNRWPDTVIRILSYTGIAIPAFIMAVLLLLLFGYYWEVIPVIGRLSYGFTAPPQITGLYVVDALIAGDLATAWNAFQHLLLPAVSLAIAGIFQEARIIRTAVSDNMNKDYVSAITGYGVPQKKVFFKYLIKPSMIPAVSVTGMDIASLMTNAFLVEVIFTWPGISRYGMNAMMGKDLNAISAVIMSFGLIFVLINIIVDIIVSYLDPRIRLGGGA